MGLLSTIGEWNIPIVTIYLTNGKLTVTQVSPFWNRIGIIF